MVKGLVADVFEIRQLLGTDIATRAAFLSGGRSNYLTARLTARCTGEPCPVEIPLGVASEGLAEGFGEVRPDSVHLGGASAAGVVSDIVWDSWGGERATGTGIAAYVPEGLPNAYATRAEATVVAFDIGTCGGRQVYRRVDWFFPQQGEVLDGTGGSGTCGG